MSITSKRLPRRIQNNAQVMTNLTLPKQKASVGVTNKRNKEMTNGKY